MGMMRSLLLHLLLVLLVAHQAAVKAFVVVPPVVSPASVKKPSQPKPQGKSSSGNTYRFPTRISFQTKEYSYVNSTAAAFDLNRPPVIDIVSSFHYKRQHEEQLRQQLKRQLADVAFDTNNNKYHHGDSTSTTMITAEDIMKRLEPLCPLDKPALHPDLNARWSFVFTGVPTIGMKLITLLSRLSVTLRPIEFSDVYLEVLQQQSSNENNSHQQHQEVQATVHFSVLGIPMELIVKTELRPNDSCQKGTLLIETFQSVILNGVLIPTPDDWKSSRDLEITYMDNDIMIARTAGGEPHLLLRHYYCQQNDDEEEETCVVTEYYEQAESKYGQNRLARSLVDRAYWVSASADTAGGHDHYHRHGSSTSSSSTAASTIAQLLTSILTGQDNSNH